MALTAVLEDYLKIILQLDKKMDKVRVTDISKELKVTKATVTNTIDKLIDLGMVNKQKYGPVHLTATGKHQANTIMQRNVLLKNFLTQTLGIDYKTLEADACMMEHIVSRKTIEKISEYLNNNEKVNS